MKIKDLFIPLQGNGLELINLDVSENSNINFVSRTAQNNGVAAQVESVENLAPFDAGLISVALGGSVLSSFVQTKPFYTAYHIMVLKPKKEMSLAEKLFYCMCIKTNAYRYNFGRQANTTLANLDLPDSIPDWVYETSANFVTTKNSSKSVPSLDISSWRPFALTQLFDVVHGKMGNVKDCESGNYPLVTAYTQNNGVSDYISCDSEYIVDGNCLTVAITGQGSVFRTFYQPVKFVPSNNVVCLVAKNITMNKYVGLFITTLCLLEIPRYSFGRIVNDSRLEQTILKLPSMKDSSGNSIPDVAFMEKYIKQLPYGDVL